MFTEHLQRYAQEKYELRLPYLKGLKGEVEKAMEGCSFEEQVLMKFLYGTMPLRDAGEYEFNVFLGFVRHSLMVYEQMEWCQEIPEDIFLHHILYYRVNTENIEDCRQFFYDKLIDRVKGLSVRDAVLEINYWCAENGTYESSDNRTISPVTVYKSGKGRCGEESTFAVTAFRSVGIPARQVYTPRWAHCDDNHAWVEVFVDGKWYFLGACEPEEVLNKGWFTNASSRALLVHTRTFSDYSGDTVNECLGQEDLLVYYNETATYAWTRFYEIQVLDEESNPVENALVSIEILNMAEYCSVASLVTDNQGKVTITIGLGDVHVWAGKGKLSCEAWISPEEEDHAVLYLRDENRKSFREVWIDTDVRAPRDYPMHTFKLTREQKQRNRDRINKANQVREERIAGYFREEDSVSSGQNHILRLSAGNFDEIYRFMNQDKNPDRKIMLESLTIKDYKDASADILESHLNGAAPYRKIWEENKKLDVYGKYILCPRILLEEMTDYRGFIDGFFGERQKEEFRRNPRAIWQYVKHNIGFEPKLDYKTIFSTPAGSLKLLQGNLLSQKILFAAICRTLGIPARINTVNLEAEIYENDGFVSVTGEDEGAKPLTGEKGKLLLHADTDIVPVYYQTWTIGMKKDGQFITLDYTGLKFNEGFLNLDLAPGEYRLVTSVRLPSGNQNASEYLFELKTDEVKTVSMRLRIGRMEDMLVDYVINDFEVNMKDHVGDHMVFASELMSEKANILAVLSEGQEPTEHVLNEMLEQKDSLNALDAQIIFLLQGEDSLKNLTVQKVLKAIPGIKVGYFNFDEGVEPLARKVYVDPEKLPLLIVTNPGLNAVYACSGYNVGSVALMEKLLCLSE
ncbi:transglutaminase domain-containing protein [Clostridium boliviensis]|uniref:Transglutaminase domain-containing protein n=1 Tax=Clostridium boliviensis TaxID=318465 RepID=A0ABU4GJC3_9CLOT|nr:transglutaminase domain-containing protein [Clostridium boliviensis]MDW2797710.1 transglutaminase domain-containing protein [Clostridium boliviensis]